MVEPWLSMVSDGNHGQPWLHFDRGWQHIDIVQNQVYMNIGLVGLIKGWSNAYIHVHVCSNFYTFQISGTDKLISPELLIEN
jgi:hypothetical protein